MKKVKVFAITLLSVLCFIGCGNEKISESEAKEIALSHAGVTKEQVTFVKSETELEDGKLVYDVEFYTQDFKEYDYQIDAKTGSVLSSDTDAENYVPSATQKPSEQSSEEIPVSKISEEQAKKIILDKVPGATEEDIREFRTDRDDGRMEYEGKVIYQDTEYEFEFNAETGEIISWEEESAFN